MSREVTQSVLLDKFRYDEKTGDLIRIANSGTAKVGDVAGTQHSLGYIEVRVLGRLYKAHRLVWMMTYGRWPKCQIDHINGIRNDNRLENLREADNALNMRNKRIYSNSSSGVSGVNFCRNRWHAAIKEIPGVQKHIGCFESFFEAVCARKSAELSLGYHENHGRSL